MGTHYGYAGKGAVLVTTLNPIITFIIMLIINKKVNIKSFPGKEELHNLYETKHQNYLENNK